jgi:hypothetical protein
MFQEGLEDFGRGRRRAHLLQGVGGHIAHMLVLIPEAFQESLDLVSTPNPRSDLT